MNGDQGTEWRYWGLRCEGLNGVVGDNGEIRLGVDELGLGE